MKENNDEMTSAEMERQDHVPANKGIAYPASSVQDNMRRLVAEGKIDEAGADAIFWLYSYAQENGFSYDGCGRAVGLSGTVVFRLFRGDYPASYAGPLEKVLKFRKIEHERGKQLSIGFVRTWAADQIFHACTAALYDGLPAYIYGASQTGKTTALLEFQRNHNHGTTKYIRMGVRWSKRRVVRELARACKCFSETSHSVELEERICRTLTSRMLLIVDEFHLALETTTDLAAKEVVEYFREVYDRTGCGLVICGTKVAETGLESGKNMLLFDQMRRRGLVKLVLPDVPRRADINLIARGFSLDAPTGQVLESIKVILRRYGLGMYIKYLQKAYALACKAGKPLTWDTFSATANGYAALANMKTEY